MIRYGGGWSKELTFRHGCGGTSDRDGKGVDRKSTDDEGSESGFGEHDDSECCGRGRITTAPGLKLGGRGEALV